MRAVEHALNGVTLFELDRYPDDRGFFEEFFNPAKFAAVVPGITFGQVNHSRSKPNVLRGLHYQNDPPQGKLVGVISGAIWDVAVDIRLGSPTRGQHFAAQLSAQNRRLLWIPAGFAHGFLVTGDTDADVIYLVDNPYDAKSEGGF